MLSAAAGAQAQNDVFAWMDKNAKAFKTLVNLLGITRKTFPANTKGTLLVPTDRVSRLQSGFATLLSAGARIDTRCQQQQKQKQQRQLVCMCRPVNHTQ
jgi:hypothetical protein